MNQQQQPGVVLSGATICQQMRQAHVTIRALATRLDIPMTRVRQVRQEGLRCPHSARDWIQAITGTDPGSLA